MRKPQLASTTSYKLPPLSIPFLLSRLTDVGAFENYLHGVLKVSKDDQLSMGYSFLNAAILERLIDALLLDPSMFGVKQNKLVQRAYQRDVPYSEFPDKSIIGKMILNLADLYREFLPVRTFSALRATVKPIRKYLLPELIQWSEHFKFYDRDGAVIPNAQPQRDLGAIFLLYFVHETKYVKVALNHTFHRGKRYEPQFYELPVYIHSQRFFEGFKFGLSFLWQALLGPEAMQSGFISKLLAAKDWSEYYLAYPVVKNQIVEQAEHHTDQLTYSVSHGHPSFQWLKRGQPRSLNRRSDVVDRLEARFAKYEVRIVSEKYTAKATSGLIITLLGAMKFYPHRTRLIRFVHAVSNDRNRYSYAIFVSAPIPAGDESEWWLFFDFCDNYTSRGLTAFRPIESFIKLHMARLEISTFKINAGQLLGYVHTYPDFSKSIMNPLIREFNNLGTLSGLRLLLFSDRAEKGLAKGFVLELLVFALATKLGYQAKWRFKSSILGKELDILAYKETESEGSELLVVECSTVYSSALLSEVESKLRLVESKSDDLVKVFGGKHLGRPRVKGWVVTTAKIDLENERKVPEITIQDWRRLTKLCRERGINMPSGLKELLNKDEFPPLFVLNPSSMIFGSTPPPSGEEESEGTLLEVPLVADGFLPPKNWSNISPQNKVNEDSH